MYQFYNCLLFALFVTVVFDAVTAQIQDRQCPYGYFQLDSQCFKAEMSDHRTWYQAKRLCEDDDGILASPTDVFKLKEELKTRYGDATFWVGGTDEDEEGDWLWATGDRIDSKYWMAMQPNNCCGGENCALLGTAWTPPLNDNHCLNKRKFICQVRALPPTRYVSLV
uniref:C-type lectin 2 n=1 Tax=Rimicaris exoculata TaxID=71621 RepID=A0A650FK83_RIMEX|nr:C-type lectin 2 [Rimicaris exoculata]